MREDDGGAIDRVRPRQGFGSGEGQCDAMTSHRRTTAAAQYGAAALPARRLSIAGRPPSASVLPPSTSRFRPTG